MIIKHTGFKRFLRSALYLQLGKNKNNKINVSIYFWN